MVLQSYFSERLGCSSVTTCLARSCSVCHQNSGSLGDFIPNPHEPLALLCFPELFRNGLGCQCISGLWVASWLMVWRPHKHFPPKTIPLKEHLYLSPLFWPHLAVCCSAVYFVQKRSLLTLGFFFWPMSSRWVTLTDTVILECSLPIHSGIKLLLKLLSERIENNCASYPSSRS